MILTRLLTGVKPLALVQAVLEHNRSDCAYAQEISLKIPSSIKRWRPFSWMRTLLTPAFPELKNQKPRSVTSYIIQTPSNWVTGLNDLIRGLYPNNLPNLHKSAMSPDRFLPTDTPVALGIFPRLDYYSFLPQMVFASFVSFSIA